MKIINSQNQMLRFIIGFAYAFTTCVFIGCGKTERDEITELEIKSDSLKLIKRNIYKADYSFFQTSSELPGNASLEYLASKLDSLIVQFGRSNSGDRRMIYLSIPLLRRQPNIITAIDNKYASLQATKFTQKIILLQVAGELQREDAFPFFLKILSSSVPESVPKTEGLTAADYDLILKAKAIHGLAFIRNQSGDIKKEVLSTLIEIMNKNPHRHLQLTALDAHIWNKGRNRQNVDSLKSLMPDSLHQFIARVHLYRNKNKELFEKQIEKK